MNATVRRIEESVVPGRRLGRHVNHDPRSEAYRVQAAGTPQSKRWARMIPILDQGDVGSCTGNATVGVLGTQPFYGDLAARIAAGLTLDEPEAQKLYSAAEVIDGGQGYPPEDQGSSGLSVAKAALAAGLISGYQHATSVEEAQTAIQSGPFIVGTNWLTSFDSPDAEGIVTITPTATVRGGHEYECLGWDAQRDLWEFDNSWGTSFGVGGSFFYSSETLATLLAQDGDATPFVPLSQPAPVPVPAKPTDDGPGSYISRLRALADHAAREFEDLIHEAERHFGAGEKGGQA